MLASLPWMNNVRDDSHSSYATFTPDLTETCSGDDASRSEGRDCPYTDIAE